MSANIDSNECNRCGRDWDKVAHAPVLRDEIWSEVAGKRESLCIGCLEYQLADKCDGLELKLEHLLPSPYNFYGRPGGSWFEAFAWPDTWLDDGFTTTTAQIEERLSAMPDAAAWREAWDTFLVWEEEVREYREEEAAAKAAAEA
jgi:hypothetical protein